MPKSRIFKKIAVALILGIQVTPSYAASTNIGTVAAPLFIALGIACVTRRMSIGGWLFYYYLQLFGSLLLSLLLGGLMIEDLNPEGWEDSALYTLFVITTVPLILIKIVETLFATRLLIKSQRNAKNIKVLRYVLLASVIVYIISLPIDYYHFPDNVVFSVLGLIFASIWTLYFFCSFRVNYVFSNWSGTWDYQSFKQKQIAKNSIAKNNRDDHSDAVDHITGILLRWFRGKNAK